MTAPVQIREVERVLRYEHLRRFILPEQAKAMVTNLDVLATLVSKLPIVELSKDPDDNFILAIAVAGQVDAVVSGDKPA